MLQWVSRADWQKRADEACSWHIQAQLHFSAPPQCNSALLGFRPVAGPCGVQRLNKIVQGAT